MLTFEDYADGFSTCREADQPVEGIIEGMRFKFYPSGRLERKFDTCPDCQKDLGETIPLPKDGRCAGCGGYWGIRA